MPTVPRNQLIEERHAQNEHRKNIVNINKNTFDVYEPIDGENNNIPNTTQAISDTDETIIKTNNRICVPGVSYNVTNPIFSYFKEILIDDETLKSENELTLDSNIVDKSLKEKLNIAENHSNIIVSENSDTTSKLNEKTYQNNVLKSTIPPKLKNVFFAKFSSNSSANYNNTYSAEKEQQNEHVPIYQKSINVEKTDDIVEQPNNPASQIPSEIALQNNYTINKREVNETQRKTTHKNPLIYVPREINQQYNSNSSDSPKLDANYDMKETSNKLFVESNIHKKSASQNPHENNIYNAESTTLNNGSVKNSLTCPSPIQDIMIEIITETIQLQYKPKNNLLSTDFLWNIVGEYSNAYNGK